MVTKVVVVEEEIVLLREGNFFLPFFPSSAHNHETNVSVFLSFSSNTERKRQPAGRRRCFCLPPSAVHTISCSLNSNGEEMSEKKRNWATTQHSALFSALWFIHHHLDQHTFLIPSLFHLLLYTLFCLLFPLFLTTAAARKKGLSGKAVEVYANLFLPGVE